MIAPARSGHYQADVGPSLLFDHTGFAEAMKGLFEDHWRRATELQTIEEVSQTA